MIRHRIDPLPVVVPLNGQSKSNFVSRMIASSRSVAVVTDGRPEAPRVPVRGDITGVPNRVCVCVCVCGVGRERSAGCMGVTYGQTHILRLA